MAYSTPDDLLIGDILISPVIDKAKFVQEAADEIDAKLGFIYKLPLMVSPQPDPLPVPNDWHALPIHQGLLLKQINNKLASGRLLLTLHSAGEEVALHAYALRLVTEATTELLMIANGDVSLDAGRLVPTASQPDRAPKVINHDEESAVDMFESMAMRPGETATWQPGKVAGPYSTNPLYIGVAEQ